MDRVEGLLGKKCNVSMVWLQGRMWLSCVRFRFVVLERNEMGYARCGWDWRDLLGLEWGLPRGGRGGSLGVGRSREAESGPRA